MRHNNHRFSLGVKKEHREAMMASLVTALFLHGRITTTLAKAKALRPFAERLITLAKKAAVAENAALKLHYRRQAIAKVRSVDAVHQLFNVRAPEFAERVGGYTRIYKLLQRQGDAAPMAIIELIAASDKGYKSTTRRKRKASSAPRKAAKVVAKKAEKVEETAAVAAAE